MSRPIMFAGELCQIGWTATWFGWLWKLVASWARVSERRLSAKAVQKGLPTKNVLPGKHRFCQIFYYLIVNNIISLIFAVFRFAHLCQPYYDTLSTLSRSWPNDAQGRDSVRQRASARPRVLLQLVWRKKGRPRRGLQSCWKTLLDGRYRWSCTGKEANSLNLASTLVLIALWKKTIRHVQINRKIAFSCLEIIFPLRVSGTVEKFSFSCCSL